MQKNRMPVIRVLVFAVAIMTAACAGRGDRQAMEENHIDFINPDRLHKNPAFSQAVRVNRPSRTVYIGGQNAVTAEGEIVGRGDIAAQAQQVARNILIALEAAGATRAQVVKWNVHFVQGQPTGPAIGAFNQVIGPMPHPPAITVLAVSGLAHPDFLIEVDAVAALPLD